MAIIKAEDIICWREKETGRILCNTCADVDNDIPLTRQDIDDDAVVICDQCGERIQQLKQLKKGGKKMEELTCKNCGRIYEDSDCVNPDGICVSCEKAKLVQCPFGHKLQEDCGKMAGN